MMNNKIVNPFSKFIKNILMGLIILVLSFSGVGIYNQLNLNKNINDVSADTAVLPGYLHKNWWKADMLNLTSSLGITEIIFTKTKPTSGTGVNVGSSMVDGVCGEAEYNSATASEVLAYINGTVVTIYSPGTIYAPTDSSYLFRDNSLSPIGTHQFSSVTSIRFDNFNTKYTNNMSYMFMGLWNMTYLDLSSFDTTNVLNMSHMFNYSNKLKQIDLFSFNTANVTNVTGMFSSCSSLTTIDLSNFNMASVQNINIALAGLSGTTNLKEFYAPYNIPEGLYIPLPTNLGSWYDATNVNFVTSLGTTVTQVDSTNCSTSRSNKKRFAMAYNLDCYDAGINGSLTTSTLGYYFYNSESFEHVLLNTWGANSSGTSKYSIQTAPTSGSASVRHYNVLVVEPNTSGPITVSSFKGQSMQMSYSREEAGYLKHNWMEILGLTSKSDNTIESIYFKKEAPLGTGVDIGSMMYNGVCGEENFNANACYPVEGIIDGSSLYIRCEKTLYAPTDSSGLFNYKTSLGSHGFAGVTYIDFSNFNTSYTTNMSFMLYCLPALRSINLSNFNTSKVTNMKSMFAYSSFTSITFSSSFDTSNVTDMSRMFEYAILENLDLSSFNTSKVENMNMMFSRAEKLKGLNLSNFDLRNITSTGNASIFNFMGFPEFVEIYAPKNIPADVSLSLPTSTFDGSIGSWYEYTGVNYATTIPTAVTAITSENDSTSSQTKRYVVGNIITIDADGGTTTDEIPVVYFCSAQSSSFNPIAITLPLYTKDGYYLSHYSVVTQSSSNLNPIAGKYSINRNVLNITGNARYFNLKAEYKVKQEAGFLHKDWENMLGIDRRTITKISFTNVKPASYTSQANIGSILSDVCGEYDYDSSAAEEVIGYVIGTEVQIYSPHIIYAPTDSSFLFAKKCIQEYGSIGFSSLTEINFNNMFDTSYVTNMGGMFYNCSALTKLDLKNFNTSNVTNVISSYYGWKGEEYFAGIFSKCTSLTTLDLSGWDISKVVNFYNIYNPAPGTHLTVSMFSDCTSLTTLKLNGWNFASSTSLSYLFTGLTNLTEVDMSNWNTSTITNMSYMFQNCTNLPSINLSSLDFTNVTDITNMISDCTSLVEIYAPKNMNNVTINIPTGGNWYDATNREYLMGSDLISAVVVKIDANNDSDDSSIKRYALINNISIDINGGNYISQTGLPLGYFYSQNTDLSTFTLPVPTHDTLIFAYYVSSLETVVVSAATNVTIKAKTKGNLTLTAYYYSIEMDNLVSYLHKDWKTKLNIIASNITSIVFTQDISLIPEGATQVSIGSEMVNSVCGEVDYLASSIYVTDVKGYVSTDGTSILIYVPAAKVYAPKNSSSLFYNFTSLKTIEFNGLLDTTYVTDMSRMFHSCSKLTSLNVSNFVTNKVTNMVAMFAGCSDLTSLNVSNFDTSSVTDMGAMFSDCSGLTSLNVTNFDTSSVTDMGSMFYRCSKLTSLNVSNFVTNSVTNMYGMFYNCLKLTSLNVSNFDTSSVTDMSSLFWGCSGLTSLDVSGFNTSSVTNMGSMFSGCSGLTSLDVTNFDTSSVTNMGSMFARCSGLTSLDVSGFNTSSVTNMSSMFSGCSGLTSLDVTNFDTSQVTSVSNMFYNCSSLRSLDVSKFKTNNLTQMIYTFYGCSNLTSLNLSSWFLGKAELLAYGGMMQGMVDGQILTGCTNLKEIYAPFGITSESEYITLPTTFYDATNINYSTNPTTFTSRINKTYCSPYPPGTPKRYAVLYTITDETDSSVQYYYYNGSSDIEIQLPLTNAQAKPIVYTIKTAPIGTAVITDTNKLIISNNTYGNIVITSSEADVEDIENVAYLHKDWVTKLGLTKSNITNLSFINNIETHIVRNFTPISIGSSLVDGVCGETEYNKKCYDVFGYVYGSNVVIYSPAEKIYAPTNSASLFASFSKLTTLDFNNMLDTSLVINMNYMFNGCSTLTSLDVSNFTTSKLTEMGGMFFGCSKVTVLDLSNWDVGNVTNFGGSSQAPCLMSCSTLKEFYAPYNMQEGRVLSLMGSGSFYESTNANEVSLTSANVYSITSENDSTRSTSRKYSVGYNVVDSNSNIIKKWLFNSTLDITLFLPETEEEGKTRSYTIVSGPTAGSANITDYNKLNISANTYGQITVSYEDIVDNKEKVGYLHKDFVTKLGITKSNISSIIFTNTTQQGNCVNIGSSLVENVCGESDYDASVSYPVYGYVKGGKLIIYCKYEIYAPTNSNNLFASFINLTNIQFNNVLNTSLVTSMMGMFNQCTSIQNLNLTSFNTSEVTDMSYMFSNCTSLQNVDMSSFNTSKVKTFNYMFAGYNGPKFIDFSNFDMSKITSDTYLFSSLYSLREFYAPAKLSMWYSIEFIENGMSSNKTPFYKVTNINDTKTLGIEYTKLTYSDCSETSIVRFARYSTITMPDNNYAPSTHYYFYNNNDDIKIELLYNDSLVTSKPYNYDVRIETEKINNETIAYLVIPAKTQGSIVINSPRQAGYMHENWLDLLGITDKSKINSIEFTTSTQSGTGISIGSSLVNGTCGTSNYDNTTSYDVLAYLAGDATNGYDIKIYNPYKIYAPTNSSYLFSGLTNLKEINFNNVFDTTYVQDISYMFDGCSTLDVLDLSSFNMSEVTLTTDCFANTSSLKVIYAPYNLKSNVTINLPTENGNWFNATNVDYIYGNTNIVTTITSSNSFRRLAIGYEIINTYSNLKEYYFYNKDYSTLVVLPSTSEEGIISNYTIVTGPIAGSATIQDNTHISLSSKTYGPITLSLADDNYDKTQVGYLNKDWASLLSIDKATITKITFTNKEQTGEGISVGSSYVNSECGEDIYDGHSYDVLGYINGTEIIIYCPYTIYAPTNSSLLFNNFTNLTEIYFDNFNTSYTKQMTGMFWSNSNLTSLDLSNFNTSNVNNMSSMFYNCTALASIDLGSFNTANVMYMDNMFYDCLSLTSLNVSNFDTRRVTNMNSMFYNCSSLTTLNLSDFNTAIVTDMGFMFANCSGLISLDLSSFNTVQVTYMNNMFAQCSTLTSIDVSKFNTSNVTNMSSMFEGCTGLTEIDVSNFSTKKVTNINRMFALCSNITTLNISNFNLINVISSSNLESLINNSTSLKEIYVPYNIQSGVSIVLPANGNWYEATDEQYGTAEKIKVDEINSTNDSEENKAIRYSLAYNITVETNGFTIDELPVHYYYSTDQIVIELPKPNIEKYYSLGYLVTSGNATIENNYTLTIPPNLQETVSLKLELAEREKYGYLHADWASMLNIDKKLITKLTFTNMKSDVPSDITGISVASSMVDNKCGTASFDGVTCDVLGYVNGTEVTIYCPYVIYLPTRSYALFGNDIDYDHPDDVILALQQINFNNAISTYYTTNMTAMFGNCIYLKEIDVSCFDVTNVISFASMFYNCRELENIDFNSWNVTNKLELLSDMFSNCYKLKSVDLSNFNTSNVTTTRSMFQDCIDLESVNLENWNTSNVEEMTSMFLNCTNLQHLDLSVFDMSNVVFTPTEAVTVNHFINGCSSLKEFIAPYNMTSNFIIELPTASVWYNTTGINYTTALETPVTTITSNNDSTINTPERYSQAYAITIDANSHTFATAEPVAYFYNSTEKINVLLPNTVVPGMVLSYNITSNITTNNAHIENYLNLVVPSEGYGPVSVKVVSSELVEKEEAGYLHEKWATKLGINKGSITKIMFTNNASDVPSGITGVNIGSSLVNNICGSAEYDYTSYEVMGYINGTEIVIYCPYTIYAPTNSTNIFTEFTVVTEIDFDGSNSQIAFSTSKVEIMKNFFLGCYYLTALDVSHFDTRNVTDMSNIFFDCPKLGNVDVTKWNTSKVTSMKSVFQNCASMTKIDVTTWDTSNVESMEQMFSICASLTEIDISNFVTNKVKTMHAMFYDCYELSVIDFGPGWDTSNVETFESMFYYCQSLTNLNLSGWNTSKVTTTREMFTECINLLSVDLSNWETSNLENMSYMFYRCTTLKTVNISHFNTQKVKNTIRMFYQCVSLRDLIMTDWDTSSLVDVEGMFYNCNSLYSIDLSSFDLSKVTTLANFIYNSNNLREFYAPYNIPAGLQIIFTERQGYWYEANGNNYALNTNAFVSENLVINSDNDSWSANNTRRYVHAAAVYVDGVRYCVYYYSYKNGYEITLENKAGAGQVTSYTVVTNTWEGFGGVHIDDFIHLVFEPHSYGDIYLTTSTVDLVLVEAGYLHREWASSTMMNLNKSTITEIIFTTNAADKPSGVTKVSIGSPRIDGVYGENVYNGLTYDVEGYLSGTRVVIYCQYQIFAPTNSSYLFSDANGNYFTNLVSLQFNNVFNTAITHNMEGMFKGCSGLTEIQTTQMLTENCSNMNNMFSGCTNLQNLDLSSFNTAKVTNMSKMFENCTSLQTLTLANFNTELVTDMSYMFYNCSKLKSIDVSMFNTINVISMNSMFYNCSTLNELNLVNFNMTYTINVLNMLYGATNLTKIISPYVTKETVKLSIALPVISEKYYVKGKANLGAVTKITNANGIDSMSSYLDGVVTPTIIIIDFIGESELDIVITYGSGLKTNMSYGIVTLSYFDEEMGYIKKYNVVMKNGTITVKGLKAAEFTITVKTTFKTLTTTESVTVVTGASKQTVNLSIQKDNKGGIYNLTVV